MENILRLAIISDLHCHPERSKLQENCTLLFSDKLRSPANEHPVESLLDVIEKEKIEVDLVLSPGDFTDQSDKQGFFSGWSYVKELSRAMKAKSVIATIGNHDIDSRHIYSNYSFDIPKKIKQNFPLSKEHIGSFWETGFTFIENDNYQILVLNSTHFHTHYEQNGAIDNPAVKGKVDRGQIEEIGNYLEENKAKNKIKIALCHHHPIKHSRLDLGEYDFVENGEDLLSVLGQHKYDLFVHGHKHDPWLRYFPTYNGYQLPILSSGSFSATNQILWINKFNYFHIIDIKKKGSNSAKGKIQTWTFKNKNGWKKDTADGFYPFTGFGFHGDISLLIDKIKPLLQGRSVLPWNKVLENVPEIENLTPEKMEELETLLLEDRICISGKIGSGPKHIYHEGV